MAAMQPFLLHTATSKKGRLMVDLQAKYRCGEHFPSEEKTTLMLRGIPRSCTQNAVMRELAALAGGMHFDFFYLPWDRNRNTNMRFAFVNCIGPGVARELLEKIQTQKISFPNGEPRAITAVFAHVQGLTLNIAHYIGSTVVQEEYEHAPVIMHDGHRLTFQEAVDQFVPPELAASQLCEAKWKARSSYVPQADQSLDIIDCRASPVQMPSHAAPPMALRSQSAAPVLPPGLCPMPTEAESMKETVLHSESYALAWRRLNLQLKGLQVKFAYPLDSVTSAMPFQ